MKRLHSNNVMKKMDLLVLHLERDYVADVK